MTTYNTGNPVGSSDVKDLYDNAQNLDLLSVGVAKAYPDRLGVMRKSWAGFEQDFMQFLINSGYEIPIPYVAGISVTRPTQTFIYNGEIYRGKIAALPFTTTNWATDSPNMIAMGDAALRQDLAAALGAYMVGYQSQTVGAKLDQFPSVKDYGCVGDGVAIDRVNFQAALDANAGKTVVVPPGTYLTDTLIEIPSGTTLIGYGFASCVKATAGFVMSSAPWAGGLLPIMFGNKGILTTTAAQRITIQGIFCDSSLTSNGVHNVHMRNTAYCTVRDCIFSGGADGTAFTESSDYKVHNNFAFNQGNCCYDQWENSTRGVVANNIGYLTVGYGMLLTGDTSINTVGQSANVTFEGNIIRGSGTVSASIGLWLQSGSNLTSQCYSCRAVGNYFSGFQVGIRSTGGGQHVIANNRIENCPVQGLSLSAEVLGNASTKCAVIGNVINNSGNVSGGAIVINEGSSGHSFVGNVTSAVTSSHAVLIAAGSNDNTFSGNNFDPGTVGYVNDLGSRNDVADVRSGMVGHGGFIPTLISSGGGTPTYAAQFGAYQIIGKWLHFSCRIAISSLGSLAAGNVIIAGLPKVSNAGNVNNQPSAACGASNCQAAVSAPPTARVGTGTSQINLFKWATGASVALTVSDITGTFEINVSGKYQL